MCIKKILFVLCVLSYAPASFAAFPDDFEGVVFTEQGHTPGLTAAMNGMAVTASLSVAIGGANPLGGENVVLDSSKRNTWRGIYGCCNANAWLFVKIDDVWHAGTWEFMRVGQTTKSTHALVGAHFRAAPLNRFLPKRGEIYGYMVAGITRNGIGDLNVSERSNIAFHKFGVGPVSDDEVRDVVASPSIAPAVDLILNDTSEPE